MQPSIPVRTSFLTRLFTGERSVAAVIVLNAVVLFLLSFDDLENSLFLEVLDAVCLLFFLIEAIVKIRKLGWKVYIKSGWNRFDFIILIFSFPSLMLLFKASLPNLAFIFVFRIIRVLRFLKFIKFVPNIKELIAGISRAFKASLFVLIAFFVYSFVVSLISTRLFQDIAPHLFGDPLTAFYNIFKVFTIEGWYEVPEQVIRYAHLGPTHSFLTKFFFIIIVISGGLFGLSIVNAIFVEEMVRDNNDDIREQMNEMEEKLDRLLNLTQGQSSKSKSRLEEKNVPNTQKD